MKKVFIIFILFYLKLFEQIDQIADTLPRFSVEWINVNPLRYNFLFAFRNDKNVLILF